MPQHFLTKLDSEIFMSVFQSNIRKKFSESILRMVNRSIINSNW